MSANENAFLEKAGGIIPDFFHDIIAYLIPGTIAIIVVYFDVVIYLDKVVINRSLIEPLSYPIVKSPYGISEFLLFLVIAYVIGRFFESISYWFIHKISRKYKHYLLFHVNSPYSNAFRTNLEKKIVDHLKLQNGEEIIASCKKSNKKQDDFFNLIQFYLRERFPNVAYYEKKQNAIKITSRSLVVIFAFNILTCLALKWLCNIPFILWWTLLQFILAIAFWYRFRQDNKYHAMYIYETFIATKPLLKAKDDPEEKLIKVEIKRS